MAVKTDFSDNTLVEVLSTYALGDYIASRPLTGGTVQTNFLVQTTAGNFVFRYYENRSKESVLFETNLIQYLRAKNYPCPAAIRNKRGKWVGIYAGKPYMFFEFIEGHHLEHPNEAQKEQLIQKVAELQILTQHYRPYYRQYRWNYSRELCRELARDAAQKLNSENASEKLKWLEEELSRLALPESLPKGICHCDFHFSNVLFENGKFKALLDFDDANYTYLTFDLIGLISAEAWRYDIDEGLNLEKAAEVVTQYQKYRPLNQNEKNHLFDVYKLSILFDCVWYFGRGAAEDFYEKRKIAYLDEIGREKFYEQLFSQEKVARL